MFVQNTNAGFEINMYIVQVEGEQKKVEWLKTWPIVISPQF